MWKGGAALGVAEPEWEDARHPGHDPAGTEAEGRKGKLEGMPHGAGGLVEAPRGLAATRSRAGISRGARRPSRDQDAGSGRRGGRGGAFGGGTQMLMLSVQGETLQGTLEAERGSTELKSIMLDGNKITFTVEAETSRGTFELTYNGEIDGDTMTGTMEGPGGRFTINCKATRAT